MNLTFAINTADVRELVEEYGVVPMLADWTDRSETIKQALADLQSISIPVLAIYPAGRPEEVIVLRDIVTKSQVLDALKQAGPSQPETEAPAAASATAMNAP
jgi:thiol:disulfide interchange protein